MRVTGYLLADAFINMGAAFVVLVVLLCLCVIVEAMFQNRRFK